MRPIRIAALADMHGYLPKVPDCDLCLISGDIAPDYGVEKWLIGPFVDWLSTIKAPIVATPGNHDFWAEKPWKVEELALPLHILIDEGCEIHGLKIWGSPWTVRFFDWAFMLPERLLMKQWEMIPTDTDILVVHSPPYGYGDLVDRHEHVGSPSLLTTIAHVQPKLVTFGHIHSGHGEWRLGDAKLVNASVVNEEYQLVYPVWEGEI